MIWNDSLDIDLFGYFDFCNIQDGVEMLFCIVWEDFGIVHECLGFETKLWRFLKYFFQYP